MYSPFLPKKVGLPPPFSKLLLGKYQLPHKLRMQKEWNIMGNSPNFLNMNFTSWLYENYQRIVQKLTWFLWIFKNIIITDMYWEFSTCYLLCWMPSTWCCLRKATQLGCAKRPLQGPWLLCSSVSTLCLYSVRSSLTPSFLLFFCLSLLLLPLSPDMWRRQSSKDREQKKIVPILALNALLEGTRQGISRAGPVAAGCQALVSQPCLHYQALSELNQGRTLQGRGDSSQHPICSVGKSYCISQGLRVRKPHEQSISWLSPRRWWMLSVFHGRLHRKLEGGP